MLSVPKRLEEERIVTSFDGVVLSKPLQAPLLYNEQSVRIKEQC